MMEICFFEVQRYASPENAKFHFLELIMIIRSPSFTLLEALQTCVCMYYHISMCYGSLWLEGFLCLVHPVSIL